MAGGANWISYSDTMSVYTYEDTDTASVCQVEVTPMGSVTTRPKALRADAQRNYDALLAGGKILFARFGVDAPFEDVAREAGVGQGTLYRHFPTRDHLFVAILQERVDFLDAKATELLDAPDAWQALTEWLRLFDQSATKTAACAPDSPAASPTTDRRSRRCAAR